MYFVDEAAAVGNALKVENSLSQNTPCQIWASTPKGPMTVFHQRIKEGRGRRIQMPWYRHPEKIQGGRQTHDQLGRVRWTSPWYERLPIKYSRKTIAQEVDMDHGQAGDMFFDFAELERHRQDHVRPPLFLGELRAASEMTESQTVEAIQRMKHESWVFVRRSWQNPWRFWFDLEEGRPAQYYSYVFGVDVSNGAGGSNSVITVACCETGHIVAKWWDSYTSPEALAVVAAAAGVWFGGSRGTAFVCWENNGPGGIFGRKLMKMGYPNYYRQRTYGKRGEPRTDRYGWHSTKNAKEVMLGSYRDALSTDRIVNPCSESMDEAADYIYDDAHRLIPAVLRDEPAGGRELHGDHCIADGLVHEGLSEFPRQRKCEPRAPVGSFAYYQRQRRRKREGLGPRRR